MCSYLCCRILCPTFLGLPCPHFYIASYLCPGSVTVLHRPQQAIDAYRMNEANKNCNILHN